MSTDDDAVRHGSENRRLRRRARRRARANRRLREPLRERIPPAGELARHLGATLRRRRRALVSLACAAGLAALGYGAGRYLATSERFAIARAELRGADKASEEELRERLGGLAGSNVFRADLKAAEARVAEHPWVESARVRRELPDGVVVEVAEHEPAALAHLGGLYLVDERGVPFIRVGAGADIAQDLVVITGLERHAYRRAPKRAQKRLREAIAAAEVYAEGDRPRLGEVHIGQGGELSFSTYDDAMAIRTGASGAREVGGWLRGFDAAWGELSERERAAARRFRIHGSEAPKRVTVDLSGLTAGN